MNLKLKILKVSNVTASYVDWFSNPEIIRYSDNQYLSFSLEGQIRYVDNCLKDENIDLYGIFDNDLHIGNIVINGLKSIHKHASITYVVGNINYWGKGVGSFAVSEIVKKSKIDYKLNRLYAGLAEPNIASKKVLEKNGFNLEGKRINHLIYGGLFYNQLDYGLLLQKNKSIK